jgi:hypothetical protein
MDRLSAMQVAQSNLREHQSGLEYMSVLLERAKSEIENSGFISERLRRKIFSVFCFWDYGVALGCVSAGPAGAGMKDTHVKLKRQTPMSSPSLKIGWKGWARLKNTCWSARTWLWTQKLEVSVFHPRRQPTSYSATKFTWTDNSIVPWISWSACNDNGRAKTCRRL